jgi:hypothetical protein
MRFLFGGAFLVGIALGFAKVVKQPVKRSLLLIACRFPDAVGDLEKLFDVD